MKPYKELFNKAEDTLRSQSKLTMREFDSRIGNFKTYGSRLLSDDEYFDTLVKIIFYSGFKAETVTSRLDIIKNHFPLYNIVASYDSARISQIMNDFSMISHQKKIEACVNNAKVFQKIVNEYGSFKEYVDSFKATESFENLILFKEEIEYKFDYLGKITAYHFMTDIGLPVLKPDRTITRIFNRIGLIESREQLLKTVIIGRKFSQETGQPIRYIDIVFAKYGQMGEDKNFGLDDGICLEESPKCSLCGIQGYCDYYNQLQQTVSAKA